MTKTTMGVKKIVRVLLLLALITSNVCMQLDIVDIATTRGHDQVLRICSREWLKSLRKSAVMEPGLLDGVPEELLQWHGIKSCFKDS